MKNFNFKNLGLCGVLLTTALSVQAIEAPAPAALETLTSGQEYVLVSPMNPTGYMSRTSWDGALYFLGPNDSNFANYALTAVQNEDETWSFIRTAADGSVSYMLLPEGAANVNMGDSAVWHVEKGSLDGYYWLKAGAGNNSVAAQYGLYMHLNKSMQYWCISYSGGPWYPDFEIKTDELGNQLLDEVTGNWQMADSTQLNWGFVTVENMKNYVAKKSAYDVLAGYDTIYCVLEEYGAGFELASKAAKEIYENPAFDGAMADSLLAILNGKIALFEEIQKTIEENADGDATLGAAIQAAMDVFNTSVKAADMSASVVALRDAVAAYEQGLGDYTTMGQNMSFEDLSAQGGNPTSGIVDAPAGWNLYINGVLCRTADELRAAGMGAWCGINADCTGEAKDGNYGFGIWNQGIPVIELSQTISGLENGTYEISAALMVGANGNGSRRTTQRIFGNLNSTYFASEPEYNTALLDANEVYTFAGLVEPVTDTEMQPISVRAYVYDGTLTFGFRTDNNIQAANRTNSNSAGGDGWFKIDNFRIQKVGYENKDALNVLQHYVDILDEYYYENTGIYVGIVEKLESTMEEFEDLDDNTPQEEINKGIHTAIALMNEVKPYMDAYARLSEAITAAYAGLDEYAHMPGAVAFAEIIAEVESNLSEGVYDMAGVDAAILRLEVALEDCKKSEITTGMDITNLIANYSFEDMTSQPGGDTGGVADAPKGWTLVINGDTCRTVSDINAQGINAWCGINSGDPIKVGIAEGDTVYQQPVDGAKLWGIWNSNIPEVELSQTITGLPMGTYTLTANVMVEYNWAGDNITTQRIFGNDCVQMFSTDGNHELNLPADAVAARTIDEAYPEDGFRHLTYADHVCISGDATSSLLRPMKVTFCVGETGEAHIGFRTNGINIEGQTYAEGGRNGQGWFKVDNFRLTYDSETVSTGIEEVVSGAAQVVGRQYFTIDGVQVAAPQQGVIIVKEILSNGQVKVSKLLK